MKHIFIIAILLVAHMAFLKAQETAPRPLQFSGYAEVYYLHDFNRPLNNTSPGFIYSHNRNNEISLNLAYVKAAYAKDAVRANMALGIGSYMNANYAAEPGRLQHIYEANVGVKISKKHNLWLDAGVFSSHLGFESAVGKDNLALSRSLFAENSPYFETGAKLSYTSPNERWFASALLLNGWQRMQRVDGNTMPAFGHQLTYKAQGKLTINSSSFIGADQADSVRQMRYFHNLYAQYQVSKTVGITAGFDIGMEQKSKGSDDYNTWYTPVFLFNYVPKEKLSLTVRAEYYRDHYGVIIGGLTSEGINMFGYSLNVDYAIMPNVLWRTEFRNLQNKEVQFLNPSGSFEKQRNTLATALTLSF